MNAQRILSGVASVCAGLLALGCAGVALGAHINITRSIAPGLYWASSAPVARGAYVLVCPPSSGVFAIARTRGYLGAGYCVGGYGRIMKRVAALGGDTVSVTNDGVRVNNRLLPMSAPLDTDPAGRPMPRHAPSRYTLAADEVLLMGDVNPLSFDGRYFGPIHRSQIQTVLRPVATW